ncbi:DNA recombination protein RmuC [Avibacterium gallinarum]|uniref:DNA recombination protein RmuC n=1 Tax=Avibacterium gallinarum TaxID=755 RepID=A0A379B0E8_AVIGA|nr:DNA recombination protein RmuC [Avibacterium gallinarum]POY43520.1 DNA recombination protein RmuC [Avibacterium gallinarum]TDP27506.1 DNA recombination protein RmuC [Avibacterium gallinarum]SUB27737.1 DNA recombination protein RmuC [Avibacterium gallinarum]
MIELTQSQWLGVAVLLLILCLVLFFISTKHQRDKQQLAQELNKNVNDFNQLLEKYETLSQLRYQLEQESVKAQTRAEGLQTRLNERDEKIHYLQQELDEEQARHSNIAEKITSLKEQFGIATAQVHSLQNQLNQSRAELKSKQQDYADLSEKSTALLQQLTELKTSIGEKEKHFAQQQEDFVKTKQQLSVEFQNLANRILEEKSQKFDQTNQASLDALLKPFREQIEGFQKRVNEIHSESLKGNASLESEIKKVLDVGLAMSQEANNLTLALKGEKKTLGNWGEIQLERALQLAGLVENDHYKAQDHFRNAEGKSNYPDFVVYLPDNKHLIIDSKMSLVAYENAVSADNEQAQQQFLREHHKAIKNHIDELSRKDYSNLIGVHSPNFVLMFIAVEPAYIEAMKQDSNLFNYAYEKNVILVSHTTLMPILRTVANLWRIERGNAEAREISGKAGEIYNQMCLVAERLAKLGNSLATVSGHYNHTVTAFAGQQGLAGKIERFKDFSAKANKVMPQVELLHNDLDLAKLSAISAEQIEQEKH